MRTGPTLLGRVEDGVEQQDDLGGRRRRSRSEESAEETRAREATLQECRGGFYSLLQPMIPSDQMVSCFIFQLREKPLFSSSCSDFRYESNGIFVLGVGFFSSDKFRLFN